MTRLTTALPLLVFALTAPLGAQDLIDDERELERAIEALVHEALPDIEADEVTANLEGGVVTLTGELNRLAHVQNAMYAAAEAPGVVEVVSELGVATAIFDADMVEQNVLRAFRTNPNLAGLGLEVDCVQGEVTLTGEVPDGATKLLAETTAAGVDGVQSLVNEIATPYHSDEQILDILNLLLEESRTAATEDLSVEVSGGYVTVSGTVPALIYAYLARDAARAVDGVVEGDLAVDVVPPEDQ